MITRDLSTTARRKPEWLKVRAPGGDAYRRIKRLLRERSLHTVCEEARCPNMGECWGGGTATIMLMGDVCTRGCRFCAVKTGNPRGRLDRDEPRKVSEVISTLGLKYLVLTSVDRDDLPDGGAAHFAETVRRLKSQDPGLLVEVLIPDFAGDRAALGAVLGAGPDVLAHNLETVRRLTPSVRDRRAGYDPSLDLLRSAKEIRPGIHTKSSIMLGLGETDVETLEAMADLRSAGVDILTLGQYLQPTPRHSEVVEFIRPERFDALAVEGRAMGFLYVASGPLVRSSYRAGEFFLEGILQGRPERAGEKG
ncbi:MAG: lipoyl synthase [Planctomycetota bacterium]|nr:lipoyl synthase [Planctomycetota bacterium]